MPALHAANLGLRFVLELCLLAALAWWGFESGDSTWMKLLLGLGAPAVAAATWGLFLSPKASVRLPLPLRVAMEAVLFGLAALALHAIGQTGLAIGLAAVFAVNRALMLAWRQDAR